MLWDCLPWLENPNGNGQALWTTGRGRENFIPTIHNKHKTRRFNFGRCCKDSVLKDPKILVREDKVDNIHLQVLWSLTDLSISADGVEPNYVICGFLLRLMTKEVSIVWKRRKTPLSRVRRTLTMHVLNNLMRVNQSFTACRPFPLPLQLGWLTVDCITNGLIHPTHLRNFRLAVAARTMVTVAASLLLGWNDLSWLNYLTKRKP